jgi:hypothetical protein
MKKCKCIYNCQWYLIDDSFGENPTIKGGEIVFRFGIEYDYVEEETAFGKSFSVYHPEQGEENPIGFDEGRFFNHFQIL